MAKITINRTGLTDVTSETGKKINEIKVDESIYKIYDSTARTAIANLNTYSEELSSDIVSINTEIGSSTDTESSSGSLYARINQNAYNIKANQDAITTLQAVAGSAFQYIGSVDEVPTVANSAYYTKSGNVLTFGVSSTTSGAIALESGNVINVSNVATGDSDGMNYVWNGSAWDALGMSLTAATTATNGYMTTRQVEQLNALAGAYKASYIAESSTLQLTSILPSATLEENSNLNSTSLN